ncbi:hypothetical protein SFC42_26025, partial [Priestia filamentosa]
TGDLSPAGRILITIMSLFWGWLVDKKIPDTYDWIGGLVCLIGVFIILWPRN